MLVLRFGIIFLFLVSALCAPSVPAIYHDYYNIEETDNYHVSLTRRATPLTSAAERSARFFSRSPREALGGSRDFDFIPEFEGAAHINGYPLSFTGHCFANLSV